MSISGATSGRMKPQTPVTVRWSASTPKSGVISAYELRYTTNNGASYTTISTSIGASTTSYTFTPVVREGQVLKVQICARNSYNKKSGYGTFSSITIYADGMSVAKVNGGMKHVRGYVKVGGVMKKITSIKVKVNGKIYSIDQYLPPLN